MKAIFLPSGENLAFAFVDAGGVGQVAGDSLAGGHGEEVAAGAEESALAVGGDLELIDRLAHVDQAAASAEAIVEDADRHLLGLLGLQIEAVDPAAVLEDDRLVASDGNLMS